MRALGIHETVMQLMVNTLNKAQQQTAAVADAEADAGGEPAVKVRSKSYIQIFDKPCV